MKVLEAKVIYESDNIEKYKKIISDIFYDFGVTGLKIEEPLLNKDPLNFYRDEKQFLLSENSVSAYFPLNIYLIYFLNTNKYSCAINKKLYFILFVFQ